MKIAKKIKIPGFIYFLRFQNATIERLIWPYSSEHNDLARWRALILFSILFGGLILGAVAFIGAIVALVDKGAWGLAITDLCGIFIGLVLLSVHRIKFEIRALITCLVFYFIGVAIIITVGPQLGGPSWLFAFAVLAGVLLGNSAAIGAILINALFLLIICLLISKGTLEYDLQFFNSFPEMIAACVNFIVVNTITALSASVLLKGLNRSEEKYRLIAKNVADVIWTTDMNLALTYISPSIYQMQGYTVDEYIKKTVNETLAPDSLDKVIKLYEKKLNQINAGDNRGWNPEVFEAEQYCKNGTTIWTSMSAKIFKGKDNKPMGILGTTRDITEHKKDVDEKIEAQKIVGEQKKLAFVGQVAGKMAHDFNNILGIIMGNTELSLMNCKEEETKRTLKLILEQTLRGKNLTKNLVAFAKDQEPKQEFFRVSEKIDLVVNLMKKDLEGIELIKEDKSGVPDLLADPGMIEHALVNLIQNSIHAISMSEKPQIKIKTYCLKGKICFEIEDNGCGIPKENLKNIYEPSFTLKGTKDISSSYKRGIKGTGYGMANVKKYIEQHKGSISVKSEFGSGTKFTISLPVIKKELTSEEKVEIQKEKICFDKSILLVEDETAIAGVQYRILSQEPCNHKVDIANDGQVAMDLFKRNKYDLISLDYILPGKINGMDVYHRIRETNKKMPILFISGNIEFLESIKDLRQKDANIGHLSKPCQNKDYVKGINKLLERTLSALE